MSGTAILPKPLPDGGHIRIVSVAGKVVGPAFERGVERLEGHGFLVSCNRGLLDTGHPYLAADDALRAEDLVSAWLDPDVDAVLCARGGYGSMRLLDRIDSRRLAEVRMPFAGFSDITALHLGLNQHGLITFHAPVVTALGGASETAAGAAVERLLAALQQRLPSRERLTGRVAAGGRAAGRLVGGNLSLLATCLPNPALSLPDGCILLIEEVAEPLYRIDRMLTGLKLSGRLDAVAGFALGSFLRCGSGDGGPDRTTEVAVGCLTELGVPIVAGLPVGHRDRDLTVPLGVSARLDGDAGTLTWEWGDSTTWTWT